MCYFLEKYLYVIFLSYEAIKLKMTNDKVIYYDYYKDYAVSRKFYLNLNIITDHSIKLNLILVYFQIVHRCHTYVRKSIAFMMIRTGRQALET